MWQHSEAIQWLQEQLIEIRHWKRDLLKGDFSGEPPKLSELEAHENWLCREIDRLRIQPGEASTG